MEFWGVEVKAGQSVKVKVKDFYLMHLSQAAFDGDSKKEKKSFPQATFVKKSFLLATFDGYSKQEKKPFSLYVKSEDMKLVLGTLSHAKTERCLDLVFDKEFELSHGWKHGSVFFCGYQAKIPLSFSGVVGISDGDGNSEKTVPSKNRANDSATETPVSSKKAKTTTQKISGVNFYCGSCKRTFGSHFALDSHLQTEHGVQ